MKKLAVHCPTKKLALLTAKKFNKKWLTNDKDYEGGIDEWWYMYGHDFHIGEHYDDSIDCIYLNNGKEFTNKDYKIIEAEEFLNIKPEWTKPTKPKNKTRVCYW